MRPLVALFLMLLCLAAVGCAQGGQNANDDKNNRFGGFYGGVSGGDME